MLFAFAGVDPRFEERGASSFKQGAWAALRPPVGPGQSPGGERGAKPPEVPRFYRFCRVKIKYSKYFFS